MAGEIILDNNNEKTMLEKEEGLFKTLEEKINDLLKGFQELKKEREELVIALNSEKDKVNQLEKKLGLLSQDREKVKTRIDQLLHHLKGIDSEPDSRSRV